jgi:serine/threonine protein kinase
MENKDIKIVKNLIKFQVENDETIKRMTDAKLSIKDFSILKVIGKGSYGKVFLVKKNDDQKVYAMKVLKKKNMIIKKQVEHIKSERRILV